MPKVRTSSVHKEVARQGILIYILYIYRLIQNKKTAKTLVLYDKFVY